MPDTAADPISIAVDERHTVSGLLQKPRQASAIYVFAHGAGAGMRHRFIEAAAAGLADRGIATLRFQFPYMESGIKRPDRPVLAQATIRAAVSAAVQLAPDLPVFAGGKSFGARMTSQAQAEAPLPRVLGLVFLGFPLHPANKPSNDRAQHLKAVRLPMLFVQGTRDALADTGLLLSAVESLPTAATIKLIDHADHSFHVPVRSGRTDVEVLDQALHEVAAWIQQISALAR